MRGNGVGGVLGVVLGIVILSACPSTGGTTSPNPTPPSPTVQVGPTLGPGGASSPDVPAVGGASQTIAQPTAPPNTGPANVPVTTPPSATITPGTAVALTAVKPSVDVPPLTSPPNPDLPPVIGLPPVVNLPPGASVLRGTGAVPKEKITIVARDSNRKVVLSTSATANANGAYSFGFTCTASRNGQIYGVVAIGVSKRSKSFLVKCT